MSIVLLGLALGAVICTGWPLARCLSGATDLTDALFEAAALGMIIIGGCAVLSAAVGYFSLPVLACVVLIAAGSGVWYARRHGIGLGVLTISDAYRQWHILATLGILFVTLILNGTPSEVIFGGRDAGVYANTGFAIARTGGIVQHDAIVADLASRRETDADAAQGWSNLLGVQSADRFVSTRMRLAGLFVSPTDAQSGAYTPQFLHLYPSWIAVFVAVFGVQLGLLATGLAGVMGVWAVGMAGRALFGPAVGVLAMLLLALNGVQVWFSRYPMSETTAQWLFFVIVYGIAQVSGTATRHTKRLPALLIGLAAGQFLLARLDFVFVLLPFAAWLLWQWLRPTADSTLRWTVGGLALTGTHGLVHLLTLSRGYFLDTFFAPLQSTALSALAVYPLLTPALQRVYRERPCSAITYQPCPAQSIPGADWNYPRILAELFVVLLVIAALVWLRRHPTLLTTIATRLAPWRRVAGRVAAVVLGAAILYAYLIRPQILTTQVVFDALGCMNSAQRTTPTGSCLALQGYIGAPITPPTHPDVIAGGVTQLVAALRGKTVDSAPLRDMYANSMANLVRVGWYISPFGIEMVFIGVVVLLWRGIDRRHWYWLAVTLLTAVVFIQLSYGTSSQTYIYIMRRYLPTIYPGFALLAAYGVVAVWGVRWWRRGLAVVSGSILVLFLAATLRPVIAVPELQGSFALVETVAASSTPRDITIVRGGSPSYVAARDAADTLALPLVSIHGQQVFGLRSERPEKYGRDLATLYRRWLTEGRQVSFLLGANGALWFPDLHFEKKEAIHATIPEFSQLRNQKPALVDQLNVRYQRYVLVDGKAPLPRSVDASDTAAQVSGFYPSERIAERTFAWLEPTAVLRLPMVKAGSHVVVTLNSGLRPDGVSPEVCLQLAGQPLPWSNATPAWSTPICNPLHDHDESMLLTVPSGLRSPTQTLLVRIEAPGWIPARLDPKQNDFRTLGVQFVAAAVRR